MDKFVLDDVSKENIDWGSKTVDDLIDRLTLIHHDYMKVELPKVTKLSYNIRRVHGEEHPELHQVEKTVKDLGELVEKYIVKEEESLFPLIREYEESKSEEIHGQLKQVISELKEEQKSISKTFEILSNETSGYMAPEDGCQTYDLAYSLLKEIEGFFHNQLEVETKHLFPKLV